LKGAQARSHPVYDGIDEADANNRIKDILAYDSDAVVISRLFVKLMALAQRHQLSTGPTL
jgi:hypothetical protein